MTTQPNKQDRVYLCQRGNQPTRALYRQPCRGLHVRRQDFFPSQHRPNCKQTQNNPTYSKSCGVGTFAWKHREFLT